MIKAKNIETPIICSFSGGETSAYMAIKLKEIYGDLVRCVFANTGEENEETLEFVDRCDKNFGLNIVWIESVVSEERGIGTGYKIVNFETASRKGEPFEQVIKKYGLANPSFPHCSRELKTVPLGKYKNDNFGKDAVYAIGIRIDEIDRVRPDYKKLGLCYPLAFWFPTTKNEINCFWRDQSFRLNLKHYEGNCKVCYKKSFRKLSWIMKTTPEKFDFFERMQNEHRGTGSGGDRVIYRDYKEIDDIKVMSLNAVEPVDDARIYEVNGDLFGYDNDLDSCGSESCEAW